MFIFKESPSPLLPLTFPGARLLMELPGMLGESEALPRVPGRTSPQDSVSSFSATKILVKPPTPTPPLSLGLLMPCPDALSSRFLSPEQIVVSIETETRNPPRGQERHL